MARQTKDILLQPAIRQRPLMMQLGLASASMAQPRLIRGKSFGNDFWADEEGKSTKASMEKVVEGLRRYQMHEHRRAPQHNSVVWSDGETRLIWFAAKTDKRRKSSRAQILVIPSMINGSEILDILPDQRSLLRWLCAQGFDVFLLEWGNMREDPELCDLDHTIGCKFKKLLNWLKQEKADTPLIGLGYCMGGLLLAAVEELNSDVFDGLAFIATPWDFETGGEGSFTGAIHQWVNEGGLVRVTHMDYMPNEWLQLIFAGIDPSMVARKFSAFAEMDMMSEQARLFVAVEDWVNGGADLPAGILIQSVNDWYIHNKPIKGEWKIQGQSINPKEFNKPSFVVIPSKDKIVPPASSNALAKQLKNAEVIKPDCGHISMMVGSKAEEQVWKPLSKWIKSLKNLHCSKA
ncbi:MAG TPA: hypothetical protein PLE43_08990 [Alphaproteobacteria bacterium]|nr:hypothetical protein [Alphaproteobacteria bacterium]HRK98594.1 hypothetical protein [Alphaproteobacteria bacterium]